MKKIIIAVLVLLLLGGAGAGYYFFFMQKDLMTSEEEGAMDKVDSESGIEEKPIMDLSQPSEPMRYFVKERKLAVVSDPSEAGVIESYLYKSKEVNVLEEKDGWVRISDYIVYEDGGEEIAEWVALEGLTNEEVIISKDEQLEILDSYIAKSDDLKMYQQEFRNATQGFITSGQCSPDDFDELGGWVRSVKFQERKVYFIYCGGMKLENKIYLDVISKETFIL
ncbi:hypothetical protein L4C33_21195 [Vibrio makurazakiensis]|uniref:hypothetical protein n=1 Tax=Vibrio makurazakiensis TaxID=2910250 RepID=UPI003D0D6531